MEFVDKIVAFLDSALAQAGIVAMVLEFLLRLIPSQKPRSILLLIAAVVRGLGAVFVKLAELLDKVVPQKLAEPKE